MTHPSATTLLTVDEAREIAEQNPYVPYELHQGELVAMTQPKHKHKVFQRRIARLLEQQAGQFGDVMMEYGFRGTPEYDSRSADVALLSAQRYIEALELDEVFGAPELIVEVLSPSNRAGEMDEREVFCLTHGCQSFWLVNPVRRTVKVTDSSRHVQWYKEGDSIPLAPFSDRCITVDEIFAPFV